MTIYDLLLKVLFFGAIPLTLITGFVFKKQDNWLMSFVQNYCGALFIFSGYVKAVDPWGTAFKMNDYFGEFKDTFFTFLEPMFEWMSEYSLAFSVFMIVFEIALGIMLIVGSRPKWTAWAFFLLVAFFLVLTGYTYLTGHVPSGVNFFEFGKWGEWVESNMKVTDCGCFGDFVKLKPKVSFFKDVFLVFPALYFLLRHKDMHQLFSKKVRNIVVAVVTLAFLLFCVRNYSWDEPIADYRPFKVGTDVRTQKQYEADESAKANKVTGYKMTNKSSGETVTLLIDEYMKEYKKYPKEEWELEQVKDNPPFETSKISEFDVNDAEGNNVTEAILSDPNFHFMVLTYKMKKTDNGFDEDYKQYFAEKINPMANEAMAAGYKVYAVTGPNDPAVIEDFRHTAQCAYPFHTADDLLLKTIQRSNPGLVLWKDGKIIQKWHIKKLPPFAEIKAQYLQ